MKATAILTGVLIKLIYDNVQCELVTKPTDAVIVVNDSVIMNCSSNDVNDVCENIMWQHYKPSSPLDGDVINTGNQLKVDFNSYIAIINSSAGNCNLKINATRSAAGAYKCMDKSNGDESSAELIIIDPDYRFKGNVSECFARYYGNEDHITQWMKSHGDGWTPVDANGRSGYQQYISVTTQPFKCNISVSKFGKVYTQEWHSPNEGTTTIAIRQIATADEFLSAARKVNASLSPEAKRLSNGNNESVSGNRAFCLLSAALTSLRYMYSSNY